MGDYRHSKVATGFPSASCNRTTGYGQEQDNRSGVLIHYRTNGYFKKKKFLDPDDANCGGSSHLDSDGAGHESDSSEELHYGPGFVSRLKNRYLSVALRGNTASSSGTSSSGNGCRRPALRRTASLEHFLECGVVGHDAETPGGPCAAASAGTSTSPSRGTMNGGSGENTSPGPTSFTKNNNSSNNSRSSRPRDRRRADPSGSVYCVKRCQSVEVLSLDQRAKNFQPTPENSSPEVAEVQPPALPPKTLKPAEKALFNMAKNVVLITNHETGPASGVTGGSKKPVLHHKRRSAGLLFGVQEKELPAPDTVKETRKIFECKSGGVASGTMVKSRSVSTLFPAESTAAMNAGPERHRKRSEGALLSAAARSGRSESHSASTQTPSGFTSSLSSSTSNLRNVATTKVSTSQLITAKPSLPQKPAKLSGNGPTVPKTFTDLVDGAEIRLVSADSLKNIRQSGLTYSFSFQPESNGASGSRAPDGVKPYLPVLSNSNSSVKQVGVIKPITRPHLPILRPIPATPSTKVDTDRPTDPSSTSSSSSSLRSGPAPSPPEPQSAKISTPDTSPKQSPIPSPKNLEPLRPEYSPPPRSTVKMPAESSNRIKSSSSSPSSTVAPPPPFRTTAAPSSSTSSSSSSSSSLSKSASGNIPANPTGLIIRATPAIVQSSSSDSSGEDSSSLSSNSGVPEPIVRSRNGSSVEAQNERNLKESLMKPLPSRPEMQKPKVPPPTQNSVVFNFVNSQKNVSHIENDGLDLSRRSKNSKATPSSSRSAAGGGSEGDDDDDDDPVDPTRPVSPCNVVFIGANVSLAKSSLRTSSSNRNLKLTFSDTYHVYEYPSFKVEANNNDLLKTSANSMGGLGSYIPSKIVVDPSFQLGVSRGVVNEHNGPAAEQQKEDSDSELVFRAAVDGAWPVKEGASWSGASSSFSDLLF